MTDATAVPINFFASDRELVLVAPMPGVEPEDISIDVLETGQVTLRAAEHGPGQERIEYLLREWSYGPYERTVALPIPVDARRANVSFGNGVLTVAFPKAAQTEPESLHVTRSGHARGMAVGHAGSRGSAPAARG